MKCKNFKCEINALERGCWDDKSCPGFIPPTHADHIRSMSDEELAKFIDEISGFQADYLKYKGEVIDAGHMLDWIRHPVEQEDTQ